MLSSLIPQEAPGPDRDAEGVENDREDRVEMDRAIGEMVQALPGRSGNEDSNGESPAATASPRSGPADGRGAGAGAELPERGEPRSGSQSPAPSRSNALAKLSATARLLVEQRAAAEAEAARRRARRIEEVRASVLLWQRRAAVEGQGGDAGNGGDGEAGGRDGGSDSDDGLADVPVEAVMHMLHTEEEAEVKGELWIELNHEWMEQEARKKADGAGREAGVARKGRGRPRAKAAAAEQPEPEQTPEAAAMRALESGRLSSKVNYDALSELFGSMTPVEGQTADQGAAAGVDGGALASGAASSMDKVRLLCGWLNTQGATGWTRRATSVPSAGGGGRGSRAPAEPRRAAQEAEPPLPCHARRRPAAVRGGCAERRDGGGASGPRSVPRPRRGVAAFPCGCVGHGHRCAGDRHLRRTAAQHVVPAQQGTTVTRARALPRRESCNGQVVSGSSAAPGRCAGWGCQSLGQPCRRTACSRESTPSLHLARSAFCG